MAFSRFFAVPPLLVAGVFICFVGIAESFAEELLPPGMPGADERPELPPGEAPASVAFSPLKTGTHMIYQVTDAKGQKTVQDWIVLPQSSYKGRPVIPLQSGDLVQILDSKTRNWVATVRGDSQAEEAEPHRGEFSWPLVLGKNWKSEFIYHDRVNEFTVGPIATDWTVEAWELVTTPAGTFPAMRLLGEPGRNNTRRTRLWYAPKLAMVVRREVVQATGQGNQRATVTLELVDYTPR